jgi:hypothetical protein
MVRLFFALLVAALSAACSSGTETSKAGDPSLLVTNDLPSSWVYITWQDGDAIIGRDSIPPQTSSQCVRFTAQPDSASWFITASETNQSGHVVTSTQGPAWFNPADRPAWKIVVSSGGGGSPFILAEDIDPALAC